MKKWLLFLIKLGLTVACLWFALTRDDFQKDFNESSGLWPADPGWGWAVYGVILGGLTIFLSALRWWVLLRAQGVTASLWRTVELSLIGSLFNLFTVGGVGGDAAKIFLLIRDNRDKKLAITMTVMVDHLVGLVAMSLTFFAVTAGRFEALQSQSELGKKAIKFGWIYFSGGLAFIALLFVMASPWVHGRIHKPGKKMRWEILRRVPEIYDVYRRKWKLAFASLAIGLVMLPVYYATFWCGVRFIEDGDKFMEIFAVMPVVDALSAMPISISGIGVREIALKTLMKDLAGMRNEVAVLGSLIGFACSLVWAAVGGILFLRPADRTSMKEIEEATQVEA
jgi:uncharacterized membrane protein YbhN (UPF0104 family)